MVATGMAIGIRLATYQMMVIWIPSSCRIPIRLGLSEKFDGAKRVRMMSWNGQVAASRAGAVKSSTTGPIVNAFACDTERTG
jgi:hypothetical protein